MYKSEAEVEVEALWNEIRKRQKPSPTQPHFVSDLRLKREHLYESATSNPWIDVDSCMGTSASGRKSTAHQL